jgi:hypothetical protein
LIIHVDLLPVPGLPDGVPLAQGGNNALRLVALLPQQILGKIGQRGAQQRREWQWPRDVDGARLR